MLETTTVRVDPSETLAIHVGAVDSFPTRCPEQFEALQNACAFVNWRRTSRHGAPLVVLSHYD